MPVFHFDVPVNGKRTMDKSDWAGWYQLTLMMNGRLEARSMWWNGYEWNSGPNMRKGWRMTDGDVRGIVRLVED